jgi:DNA-binding MarR family transcriptional regulator
MSVHEFPAEDQVELSGADAREIARLLALLLKKELSSPEQNMLLGAPTEGPLRPEDRAILVAKARALFAERKRRSRHFKSVMFGEPAWDVLLALYITDFAGGRQSIGKLINWTGEPQTTALRWINYLEKERLISRETHPLDRRTVIVEITPKGRDQLDRYFSEVAVPLSG